MSKNCVLGTLCSEAKTQEQPATWKNRFHAHKKNPFSKDLKTQLLGEQNQHATTSLGNKKHETGLIFEFFSTTPPLATNEAPQKHPLMGKKVILAFYEKKKSTIIDVEGMEYNSERPKIVPKKLVNITSGMLPFLVAINLNVIFQKN